MSVLTNPGPLSQLQARKAKSYKLCSGLSVEEQKKLNHILARKWKFIDHPDFHKSNVRQKLFSRHIDMSETEKIWHNILNMELIGPGPTRLTRDKFTLNIEDEIWLFKQYNYARLRTCRMITRHRTGSATIDHSRELIYWAFKADEIRSTIVVSNLGLAIAMIKRQISAVKPVGDTVCEQANSFLVLATNNFDLVKGWRFSTYACNVISKNMWRQSQNIQKRKEHEVVLDIDPDRGPSYNPGQEEDRQFFSAQELGKVIEENSIGFPDRTLGILRSYFYHGLTFAATGKQFGLCKERVRQVIKVALAEIKEYMFEFIQ
jgi:RNA polymerase primary sigma factor